ncbi:MAG: phosphoribosylformylglycinamidine synthase subunit PurS [Phycisphaerales bacterium]
MSENGRVHRVEVRARPGMDDPRGRAVVQQGAAVGVAVREARTARVYLIQGALKAGELDAVCAGLLADPVTERAEVGASAAPEGAAIIEVHPLPGVMDPVAQSVAAAIRELVGAECRVSTGVRYELIGVGEEEAKRLAERVLANPVVHAIHTNPLLPERLPQGHEYRFKLVRVPIRALDDAALEKLSREAHLFLSPEEMRAIRDEYRRLEREPTDIELETLAQTWSEHCVHKTLKSRIRYRSEAATQRDSETGADAIRWEGRPGHTVRRTADGVEVEIDNLLKSTVAAATFELIADGVDWTLSVFKDNSGVIALDERNAVCIKVETHNHPSAIEPYGGAATGAGGCIRDVIGTGLGAKPIANTDVFCVALPDRWDERTLPPGCLHPRRVLTDVVAGVRDYGNRMGIPTLNGAVYFDDRYIGNPLVFCGCIGVMPRDKVKGGAKAGDRIVALGGRTGRDGIHGATFSSAELEQTASDEFAHAVQIGNAIEEKRVLDAILRARDEGTEGRRDGVGEAGGGRPLYNGITDCGAGGFSSAVGEMGAELGAEVHLDRAPLKYAGLSYTEVWISEAQERMVLAVPAANIPALRRICEDEGVEMAELGTFGTPTKELVLFYRGTEVGRLSTAFLHEGLPQPVREAVWEGTKGRRDGGTKGNTNASLPSLRASVPACLCALLAHPNIASKHWIIRQYDHEVQGNTVVKPLVGPAGRGPGDGSVIEPVAGSGTGVAVACGLQTGVGDPAVGGDPYLMALAAIDECIRNLVCVGADPSRIAILDNFCWPSCAKPGNLGALVRAAEGCYDGAKAYRTPFVSGKDSLNNQLRYTDPATGAERLIEIPPTLLITGIGIVPRAEGKGVGSESRPTRGGIGSESRPTRGPARIVTMEAKREGNVLVLVGETKDELGGSHLQRVLGGGAALAGSPVPRTDLRMGPRAARAVAELIRAGVVRSAHDVSDGGLLCAIAEMLIGADGAGQAGIGALLDLSGVHAEPVVAAFSESPSRYVLEVSPLDLPAITSALGDIAWAKVGVLDDSGSLRWAGAACDVSVEALADAWLRPLDW